MLTACARKLGSFGANSATGARVARTKAASRKNIMSSSSYEKSGASVSKSLAQVSMRKYAEAATSDVEAVTKKWNLELNKLYKLRYYEEAIAEYEKMKASGATPNSKTFMIMFDTFMQRSDENGIVALLEEIKARGLKTYFQQADAKLRELSQQRETREKAIEHHQTMVRLRKAGLNPFDPPK